MQVEDALSVTQDGENLSQSERQKPMFVIPNAMRDLVCSNMTRPLRRSGCQLQGNQLVRGIKLSDKL